MKNLFKLTTAALALVAFASCSNEDLFGDGQKLNKDGIKVEVEDLIDANTTLTRSAYTPTEEGGKKQGQLSWNTTDIIRVTDATMVKYDKYKFDGSAFVFDKTATGRDKAYLTEPKYASYPDASMRWENALMQSIGEYIINPNYIWGEDWEVDGAFTAEIPLWGTVEKDDTYGISTKLQYLTAVLRINLDNIPGNATNVRVTGWKNLAGTQPAPMATDFSDPNKVGIFQAIYATDDELDENATLAPIDGLNYTNSINVNVNGATKSKSYIFLPLIVQKYQLLTIDYSNDNGGSWTKFKDIKGLDAKRRTWYNFTPSEAFKVAGTHPSDITVVLEEKKSETEEIKIETGNITEIVDDPVDNTITIPETTADVTLTLKGLKGATANKIIYIDAAGDYAGTLTLDVAETTDITNLYINLPGANVVINKLGESASVDLGKAGTEIGVNVAGGMVAKALVINKDAKIKNIFANAELGDGNTADKDLKIVKGASVTNVQFEKNYQADEIEINGTLGAALDMTSWKDLDNKNIKNVKIYVGNGASTKDLTTTGDVTVTGGTVNGVVTTDGNVTISGKKDDAAETTAGSVKGIAALTEGTAAAPIKKAIELSEEASVGASGITAVAKHTWTLTVKGKAAVAGTADVDELTINGTSASVATVTVAGDATINDTEEAEAIKTKLNMTAGKTLNLNGGYIKELGVTAAEGKALTIQHGTAAAYTAIAAKSGDGLIKVSGTSVWNGKKVGDGTKDATAKAAIIADYATDKSNLFTATQLASYNGAVNGKLYANVDLNSKEWNGISLTGGKTFEGADMDELADEDQYPTIENLYIYANDKEAAVEGAGLFAKTTGTDANTIQNFTLKNVTSGINGTKGVSEFGALVGSAVTELTIKNVTVETATIGTTKVAKVGGLVGNTTKAITLNKVTVKALTLNGESQIGGVVGVSTGTTSVDVAENSTITVTAINVPTEHQSTPDITKVGAEETIYGAVGMIAGAAAKAVSVADGKTLTVNDLITGHRQKMGYTWYYNNPGPGLRYYHGLNGDKNKSVKDWVWVGILSGAAVNNIDNATAFEDSYGTSPAKALMVKHDIYTSCDK